MTFARSRSEDCLSDLKLDRRLAGELDDAEKQRAEQHLTECARCRDRNEAIVAARDAFVARRPSFERPPERPLAPPRRLFSPRRIGTVAAALVMAASLALVLRRPHDAKPSPETSAERTKGGASQLGFYVKRGEHVALGQSGQIVHPGDQLRFVVRSKKSYVAILSLDGARHASIYFPAGTRAERVDGAQEVALPASTELDAVLGPETLVGYFCDDAIDLASVRDRLGPGAPPSVPGCETVTLSIRKEQPE